MLFWPVVLAFSWEPAAKCIARILLAIITSGIEPKVNTPIPLDDIMPPPTTLEPKLSNLIPGIYDYESSVNFDNYLAALGVNYLLRKLAGLAYPVVTISTTCKEKADVSRILFLKVDVFH